MGYIELISRTKAVSISAKVKKRVAERDSFDGWNCCILCGSPEGQPNAHVIPRSDNGMGVEGNIVTLCWDCHRRYDNTEERMEIRKEIIHYLKKFYPDWSEEKVRYKK